MKVLHVVGARPNFMKMAPVHKALAARGHLQFIVHTGQHYDAQMSDIFFKELDIPEPDENLQIGSGSHAQQTALIMQRFESALVTHTPDLVLVYGDVNSTVAATLVCAKLGIRSGHVEAGLRSFDRSMPEEINRLVTDQLADLLFTPSVEGNENLAREGVAPAKVFLVGNVMIDTLVRLLPQADAAWTGLKAALGLGAFGLVTIHRPSNADDDIIFPALFHTLQELSRELPLLFPIHPRTKRKWSALLTHASPTLKIIDPIGYIDCLALQKNAAVVISDSGGIQEETTFLGTPCITVRENTERPVTLTLGTNVLIGHNMDLLKEHFHRSFKSALRPPCAVPLWDGKAAGRIADIVSNLSSN
ncbi:MAG TPA: UDP-N-acetylglucosamine 2-epimerase (non-hydrolyzing) [Terracidiphilus sp.]|jgi:UDP-N-acetylglucosamine 2-epimerase (non-hydrolysing)